MKTFVAGAFLCTVLGASLATTVEQPAPFPYQQSWRLQAFHGHGSMVPVQRRKNGMVFMTAKHVTRAIAGSEMVAYHPEYGRIRKGIIVLSEHPKLDLALVFVPNIDERIQPVKIGPTPSLGDRCTVVAYPGPGKRRVTEGNICGPDTMSAQVIGGSSGGPVLDAQGRLIGVVRAVDVKSLGFARIEIQWMGYFTPVSRSILSGMLATRKP